MDDYAGRVLADRYRLPRPPADEYELVETRAFDTYSGQEVLIRQVLLPEVVGAEPEPYRGDGGDTARRALEAARAAAAIPDHPRLVQVFDIFVEDGSVWIVSELVSARPLAALLADKKLSPYRAAEVGNDVLTALRVLHAHGWTHRNVTAGTVLVCDDGRAMLSGLAVGAAQEALCGYNTLPVPALTGGGEEEAGGGSWEGPHSVLELERARQARLTVVGPVTERWAPEQATEVHENWQLAPPVGPAADLWALGSLLFRSVQGHPPFPEESTNELVQLVVAEPPAFAEECGPLRPVVESLLRQDPEERPDVEELRGWLRSLVRSAPEPDLGLRTVPVPADDPHKLPIVRRRGELVRRRKAAADPVPVPLAHGRHKRSRERKRSARGPRTLGLMLVALVLALLAAAVVYAVVFLPRAGTADEGGAGSSRTLPAQVPGGDDKPQDSHAPSAPSSGTSPSGTPGSKAPASSAPPTRSTPPGNTVTTGLGGDFQLRTDPAGFHLAVPNGWHRSGRNGDGQVRYTGGDYQLLVVPGRDAVAAGGGDPMAYQNDEPELAGFRASSWSSASGLRRLDMGGVPAAEGEFSWSDASGQQLFARNLVMVRDGKYHIVLVVGPDNRRSDVKRYFEKAAETYGT
ncbi:serine/threonine protein kinase [Streptomyces sp. MI02-7b]|uniref:serine/threonine protein kinase n=1 Tax=Streptomyces sp. MI02-7b TaxID=462941 RepID=UPI0029B3A98B|nr:protein kinase [Streptomyces sp. MI02-7b]MDX3071870.1 protein kinase [Streptomyces sp. MI02-7b]